MAISHDDCENSQNLGQSPTLITTVVLYLSTVNKGLSVGSKDQNKKADMFGKIGACSPFFHSNKPCRCYGPLFYGVCDKYVGESGINYSP